MKLELALLAGAESKEFLLKLTKQIDRLEALCGKLGDKGSDDGDIETESDEEDEDEDFGKKPAKKSKAKDFDEDEEAGEAEVEEESDGEEVEADEDEEEEAPVKKGKAKKLTIDDCNDAAKACALAIGGKPGRAKVLELMKKHFKTESVSELKPEQYAKFINKMQEFTEE